MESYSEQLDEAAKHSLWPAYQQKMNECLARADAGPLIFWGFFLAGADAQEKRLLDLMAMAPPMADEAMLDYADEEAREGTSYDDGTHPDSCCSTPEAMEDLHCHHDLGGEG